MKQVSDKFKNISKKIKQQDLKVLIKETSEEITVKELKYNFEGELFKTIMQEITFSIKNAQELEGKTIQVKYGLLVDNEYEYVDIGEYVVKDIEEDKKKEETSITCYDNMLKFMAAFNQDNLEITYPCTMLELVQKICQVCGVELYSTDFYNSELSVTEDFFTVQQLNYRDVLVKIAQSTLSTIFIKENKLYLCNLGNEVQTLDASYITAMTIEEKVGPINALVLGRGDVEDNIESIEQESIDTYGRYEIRFDENEFLDDKRETVIDNIFNQIKGIEYYAFESSDLGVTWLDPCDWIELQDREGKVYKVLYLKGNITINTGITGKMSADIPTTTETEYKITTEEQKKNLRVERLAKKNEGLIQDVIEEQNEQVEKMSKLTQTVDSFSSEISNKVGEDEIISKINQSAEAIQINANKVSLEGKEIDLTGDNVTITSNNFSVDEEGNIVCKNALITGGEINVTKTYFSEDAEKYVTETIFKISEDIIEIGKFNFFPTIDSMSGDLLPNFGIENIAILKYNKGYSGLVPFDLNINNIKAAAEITTEILYAKNSIMISKNGTQGYGLCNSDGVSIIRDHNYNGNVSIDATGGVLYLGFENTTGINILNGKLTIDSAGRFYYNSNGLYSPNSAGIYFDQYGNIHKKRAGSEGGKWSVNSDSEIFNANWYSGLVTFNYDVTVKGHISASGLKRMDSGEVNITPSAANTPTVKAITFDTIFKATPNIVATAKSSVPGTTVTGVGASATSASGANVYVTRTNTTQTTIYWIAMDG